MIYTIGDSHCYCTFDKIKNIITNHVGPITMKRVGYPEETLIHVAIKKLNILPNDIIILCFGEIDIRCYVKPNLIRHKNITLYELLEDWVNRYLNEVCKLQLPENVQIFIMSVKSF